MPALSPVPALTPVPALGPVPALTPVPVLGQAVLVATAPHSVPGQLTWDAWQLLHAGPVLAQAGHPHLAALRAAGVDVEAVPADELTDRLAARTAAGQRAVGVVVASPGAGPSADAVRGAESPPGSALLDVVAVMDRLRSPGGCPWDAAQTHASLRPYLLEEAYEAYEAIEDDDPEGLREELGDVLLQVVFHARLAQEADPPWSVDDVAGDLVAKLVRRHPHVFARPDGAAGPAVDEVETSWDALKAAEKGRTSVTEGVPLGQPALSLAAKLQGRGAKLGVPLPAYDGLGGALWELVGRCRAEGVDPEAALRAVARRYRDALAAAERSARDEGLEPAELGADDWSRRWGRP